MIDRHWELSKMKLSMACSRLSSKFLLLGNFQSRSYFRFSLLNGTSLESISIQCMASGQSESDASARRLAAEDNPFVKPLSNVYSVVPCRFCKGSGEIKCNVCDGQGSLARGGFHKRNPVTLGRIVGSKWTAMESTFGWRHFHVNSKRKGPGKDWFLELVSTCDDTTRFWVNAKNLKGNKEATGTICKACKGRRTRPCQTCAKPEGDLHHLRALDIIDV